MDFIVNKLISSYLADYLEINPEKTKLSVISGTVDLYGVKFKKNLFSTLNLPYLELEDGFVGRIHVSLKLPRFHLNPIIVEVDKIYVKVKPKNMNKIQDEEIMKTYDIYKKKQLKQFEELMNIKFSLLMESEKDKTKKEKKKDKKEKITILENIINNLHIKIQSIVIIYDDCISNPKYPVTLGVTINQIFIDSFSKDFKSDQLSEEDKKSHLKYKKLIINNINIFFDSIKDEDIIKKDDEIYTKLKIREETKQNLNEKEKNYLGDSIDFYLYCESEIQFYSKDSDAHSYLLRDLSPEIRVIINEKFFEENNKEPQMDATVDIKIISLEVSNNQIKALTDTINYITLKDFYQQTTIENHFKKIEKIDDDLIGNYLEEYSQYYKTKYIEIYKNAKENKKYSENMEKLEKNLKLESIKTLREMGNDIINSMIEIGKLDKEIKTAKGGFLGHFKSKKNPEVERLKTEREKKVQEQKELQLKSSTLNQFKSFVTGMLQNNEGDALKENKVEFLFKFIMGKLILIIKEEKKKEGMKKIFEINFIRFETDLIIKTISQYIMVRLQDMKFIQYLSKNKNYETILFSENSIDGKVAAEEDISLILIEFEHNITLKKSPFSFKLNFGKQIFIIVDYYYLYYLYNLFLKHISALDFNNLSSLVNDKITSIIKVSYDNLVKNRAIEEEKEENNNRLMNLNIIITLKAPILLFPLYFQDEKNSQMLYISLGTFKMISDLADPSNENEIYDKYNIEFFDFIMKTIDFEIKEDEKKQGENPFREMIKDNIGEKIIHRSSFFIKLQNYVYQTPKKVHKTKDFSPLLIKINLNNIKFCLYENQIIFLINYLENFMRTKTEFERKESLELEKKNSSPEKLLPSKEEEKNQKPEKVPMFQDDKSNQKKEKIPFFKEDEPKQEKTPLFQEDKNIQKIDKVPLFDDDTKNKKQEKIPLFQDDKQDQKKEKIPMFKNDEKEKKDEIKKDVIKSEENKKEDDKKEENKKEENNKDEKEQTTPENKPQEITNMLILDIKFGTFEFFLFRNLTNIKKIKFLSLNFQESALHLIMKSNSSMNMNFAFGHFCLKDEDIRINTSTNKEASAVNPEFKYIIGTTFFDFKTPKTDKIKFSEIYNYNKEKENNNQEDKSKNESIKIEMNLDSVTNKMDIDIKMCKLTISPNFSIMLRAYEFIFKYLDILNKSFEKLKFEQLRENFNKNNNVLNDEISKAKGTKQNKNKKNNNQNTIVKSREKTIMNLYFSMEGINLMLPIDHDLSNTYIIFMSLEMPMNFILKTDADYFYKDSKLFKINYFMKLSQLRMNTNEANFSIYEYKDDYILLNSKNQIIEYIKLSFLMNNNLDNKNKANLINLSIYLDKETELTININQIIIFMSLFEKVNEFMKEITKDSNNKITLNIKQEFMDDDDFKRSVKTSIINARVAQEEIEKIRGSDKIILNNANYVDKFTYDIVFSNFYIKFYDIIDGLYQSLFEFSMKHSKIEFYQNSNPKDSTNLVNYLKDSFITDPTEKKKFDTYEKTNFFMYLKATTKIEIKSLNNYLNQWEYFVEPFKLEFYFCQLLKRMRPNIELFINNIININLSLNFANILQFVIKKFTMEQEEIKKKKEEVLNETKNDDRLGTPKYLGCEAPVLILENYSGVDMEIWFDNIKNDLYNKNYIIKIKSNEKYEFTINSLNKFNVVKKKNNLNSTISYKFCLDQSLIDKMKVDPKNLLGQYLNINYHNIIIHDISKEVKVSVECCSDNLLIRHIIFSSLLSLRNETKFQDIEMSNNGQKILLKNKKWQTVPISWLLDKANPGLNLIHEKGEIVLFKNFNDLSQISRVIKFKSGDVVMCDIIKYKFNLNEYYSNKDASIKREELYKTEINITSPIYLINNTPYDFVINNNEKILSTSSISSYTQNSSLLLDYRQKINNQNKKFKNCKNEVIEKIVKDIKFQIIYNNQYISAETYLIEKEEDSPEEINMEGKAINNFAMYNKSTLILLRNKNAADYFICRLILFNPYKKLSFDNKIYEEVNIELNSFRYEIIFDYYFVNKTKNDLYFNNKTIDLIKASKENILISSKKFIPISKILLNSKVKFRKTKKDWTDNFEYTALGKEFTLNVKNENQTYNSFSIIAKVSTTFKKSITFIMEEKFIIINELPFDISIKEDKMGTLIRYKAKESNILLLDKESKDNKSFYKVGIDYCYSHMFDPSKLGSYDLLIVYDKKTFDKYKIDTQNKLIEYDDKLYFPIRCVINTINKYTIYIIFSLNQQYINQFRNCTKRQVKIYVNDNKSSCFTVNPENTIPLVYINKDSKYKPFENIDVVLSDDVKIKVSINEIATKHFGFNKDYYIRIQPEKNNSVKSIKIYEKKDRRIVEDYLIKKRVKRYTTSQGGKILLNLEGIGFSLIDETPKELFYFSLYKLFLNYNFSSHINILNEMSLYDSLTFSIKNMELDYCLENAYDIIFNPTNQILPPKSDEKVKKEKTILDKVMEIGDEDTPFIQLVVSKKTLQEKIDNKMKVIYTIFPEIALIIQEFDVRINTILINCFINLANQYIKIFNPEDENNNEMNANNINKEKNLLIENDQVYLNEAIEKLLKKGEDMNNLIINYLTLSAIKVNTTFKINKNAIDFKFIPELLITILNTLCSTLTSFSDVTIKLNEFTFANVFNDMESLSVKLLSFYKNKLLAQIYKVIFNMDIIGNPVNLVEGLGTGIFEFFNEPRKGLLKGPEEFGIGIAKGTRSLVSNIVGGGFKSASKITGTLLSVSKNISSLGTEEEVIVKEEEKPRGLLKGTLSGFKKGFGELASGFTGIVTKPIEQTKKSGVGGFFKGLGSGLLGAVLSPVNSVLTVGNEVTSGISNSEYISNKKSLRRFRLPRTLYKYIPISPYNEQEEMELKQKRKENEGKETENFSLSNESLYLENSTEIIKNFKLIDYSILIFTDVMIKIMDKEGKKPIKKIYVCNIENIKERDNEIQLVMKNTQHEFLKFRDKRDYKDFIKKSQKYLK